MTYKELRKKQQEEFNKFPMKFAFSKKQLVEGMLELGLEPTETDKIYGFYGGGFYRKEDHQELMNLFKRQKAELKAAMADIAFATEALAYELANHEYGWTGDEADALSALDLTPKKVNDDPVLRKAFVRACKEVTA